MIQSIGGVLRLAQALEHVLWLYRGKLVLREHRTELPSEPVNSLVLWGSLDPDGCSADPEQ